MARKLNQAIGFDVSQGVGALKQIEAALVKYNQKLSDISSATQKHDKAAHENILTITTQIKANEQLVQTFERVKGAWVHSGEVIVRTNKEIVTSAQQTAKEIIAAKLQEANELRGSARAYAADEIAIRKQMRTEALANARAQVAEDKAIRLEMKNDALANARAQVADDKAVRLQMRNDARANARAQVAEDKEAKAQLLAAQKAAAAAALAADKQTRAELAGSAKAYSQEEVARFAAEKARVLAAQKAAAAAALAADKQTRAELAGSAKAYSQEEVARFAAEKARLLAAQKAADAATKAADKQTRAELRGIAKAYGQEAAADFDRLHGIGTNAAKGILISWQSVLRLFAVQVLHQAISLLVLEFRQAIAVAEKFSISIGEIQTISQHSQLSYSVWTAEIRKLSDELGNPAPDVAKAVYEALSNQVAEGAASFAFVRKEMKLAATTVSTVGQAVDATTAILNAFNLNVSETDRVNAILFKTVDLGRVKLDEMSSSIGRASVLSAQLNVTYEEQQAALTALTIKGIKFNVAQTFYVNMLNSLLKPTDEMSKKFQSWGVTSGAAAIQTFGLTGVLKKLFDEFQRGGDVGAEAAEVFNRLRALQGFSGLAGAEGDFMGMNKALEEMKNAAPEFEQAFKLILETPGKQFQIEVTKLKNIFLVDFAEPFIAGLVSMTEPWGGFANVTAKVVSATLSLLKAYILLKAVQLTLAAASMVFTVIRLADLAVSRAVLAMDKALLVMNSRRLLALTLNLAIMKTKLFFTNLWLIAQKVGLVVQAAWITGQHLVTAAYVSGTIAATAFWAAATLGVGAVIVLWAIVAKSIWNSELLGATFARNQLEAAAANAARQAEDRNAALDKELADYRAATSAKREDALQFIASVRAMNNELVDYLAGEYKRLNTLFKADIDDITDALKDQLKELEKQFQTLERRAKEADDLAKDITTTDEEATFAFKISDLDPLEKAKVFTEEKARLEKLAKEQLNEGDIKGAKETLKQIEQLNKEHVQIITKFREDARTAQDKDDFGKGQKAGKNFIDNPRQAELDAIAELARLEKERHDIAVAMHDMAVAEAKSAQDQANKVKAEIEAKKEFIQLFMKELGELDSFQVKGQDDVENFGKRLDAAKQAATEAGISPEKQAEIFRNAEAQRVVIARQAEAKITDDALKAATDRVVALDKQAQEQKAARVTAEKEINDAIAAIKRQANDVLKKVEKPDIAPNRADAEAGEERRRLQKAIEDDIAKVRVRFIHGDLTGALEGIKSLQARFLAANLMEDGNFDAQIEELRGLAREAAKIKAQQDALIPLEEQEAKNAAEMKEMTDAVDEARKVFGPFVVAVDASTVATKTLKDALLDLIAARRKLAMTPGPAVPGVQLAAKAFGGEVAYNAFGGPRGTDTKLSWLTPGERVLTRAENKMYYPILKALGQQPMYRAMGGPITNVGDINVNVNGGDTSQQTVSSIGRELQRQIRRGLLTL